MFDVFVAIKKKKKKKKNVFCRDKSMLNATKPFYFVATKPLWRQIFVAIKDVLSSRQTRVCRDKSKLVATEVSLSGQTVYRDKIMFVATKICLSRQAFFCRDKRRVLSRQKLYLWQLPPMIKKP